MAGVQAVLDAYLGFSPGCTFENGWCNAPEHALGNGSATGCRVGGAETSKPLWSSFALATLAIAFARARRRRLILAVLAASFAGALGPYAHAETSPPDNGDRGSMVAPPVPTPVAEPGPRDPNKTAFGVYVGGSGSISNEAFAAALGARLRASKHWTFGLDGEWNPFIAVDGASTVRAGAFNLYGTVIFRLPLAYEKFNLRVTGNAGMSRLLIDLYGAPKGSTGVYAGLAPLGLEWKMSRLFYLIVNPLNVAVPVPQLQGVPFSYPQYRASIGLELYFD
jgi:MYXO-CTERM domain-containing protein